MWKQGAAEEHHEYSAIFPWTIQGRKKPCYIKYCIVNKCRVNDFKLIDSFNGADRACDTTSCGLYPQ